MDTVVADAGRAAMLKVASDAMPARVKGAKLFDVGMVQVSRMIPLLALDWSFGSRFLNRPRSGQLRTVIRVEKGATSGMAMCRR